MTRCRQEVCWCHDPGVLLRAPFCSHCGCAGQPDENPIELLRALTLEYGRIAYQHPETRPDYSLLANAQTYLIRHFYGEPA